MQNVIVRLEASAQKVGLEINERKTWFMTWSQGNFVEGTNLNITMHRGNVYSFEDVESFTYLRTQKAEHEKRNT